MVTRVATAEPVIDVARDVEEPLTPDELAKTKRSLRFLKEHRKVLQLKVNAHEDLLLNEVREPTHRGICQHLFSKVDRARVAAAAQRLEPVAATRLVEGVLGISPDLDYLLLYLDCVRRSASSQQAVAALGEALEHIDFAQVTAGQMKRLLDLIVELFDQRHRPRMLLGLLANPAFRAALDASVERLPDALAGLVVPLRAVERVVLHGKPAHGDNLVLEDGLALLLDGGFESLERLPFATRRRLMRLAVGCSLAAAPERVGLLEQLLDSLGSDALGQRRLGIMLVRAWINAGLDADGRRLAEKILKKEPGQEELKSWLEALSGARIGRFSLVARRGRVKEPPPSTKGPADPPPGRHPGWSLELLRPVSLWVAAEPERSLSGASVVVGACLPGVASALGSGVTHSGRRWLAMPTLGRRMHHLIGEVGQEALVFASLSALARLLPIWRRAGLALPDVDPARFEVDAAGGVWLVDLTGVALSEAPVDHSLALVEIVRRQIEGMRGAVPPRDLVTMLQGGVSLAQLAAELGRLALRTWAPPPAISTQGG